MLHNASTDAASPRDNVMPIVDTHAHLDMPEFAADLPDVLARAAAAGVRKILCVGTDLASSLRCVELARSHPDLIAAAVGIHPTCWHAAGPDDMAQMEGLASLPEVVAIGETGMDFYHEETPEADQVTAFEQHIRLSLSSGKPLIVHSRRADEEVLAVLAGAGRALRGVRHCFDGSAELAEKYIDLGLHVALGAAVTRDGYKQLKAATRAIPAGRLLLETDCPYQSPASHAGGRNEPAFLAETLAALAALRAEPAGTLGDPAALAAAMSANALALFFNHGPLSAG